MHLDDNSDYMTIWKLAHNWGNADHNRSDENTISLEIKNYIHRLLEASYKREISVRTHQRRMVLLKGVEPTTYDYESDSSSFSN